MIDELERELKAEQMKMLRACEKVIFAIQQLADADEQRILILRYVNRLSWEEIDESLDGFSWSTIHRIHGKALTNISELIESDKLDIK